MPQYPSAAAYYFLHHTPTRTQRQDLIRKKKTQNTHTGIHNTDLKHNMKIHMSAYWKEGKWKKEKKNEREGKRGRAE